MNNQKTILRKIFRSAFYSFLILTVLFVSGLYVYSIIVYDSWNSAAWFLLFGYLFWAGVILVLYMIQKRLDLRKQIRRAEKNAGLPFAKDVLQKTGEGVYLGREWLVFESDLCFSVFHKSELISTLEYCTHPENRKGLLEVYLKDQKEPFLFLFQKDKDPALPKELNQWLGLGSDVQICPFCQSPQKQENRYCENCGRLLIKEELRERKIVSEPVSYPFVPPREVHSFQRYFVMGLAALAILVVLYLTIV